MQSPMAGGKGGSNSDLKGGLVVGYSLLVRVSRIPEYLLSSTFSNHRIKNLYLENLLSYTLYFLFPQVFNKVHLVNFFLSNLD